jgi:hypothetical protein
VTHAEYLARVEQIGGYWQRHADERWAYLRLVAEEAARIAPRTALEIGTNGMSILPHSDTCDSSASAPDNAGRTLYRDATATPWPVADGHYDLLIACQVLEHLSPHQPAVWREIRRTSRAAIITLPYRWNCPADPMHHAIDDERIAEWTYGDMPYRREVVQHTPRHARIMLCYRW